MFWAIFSAIFNPRHIICYAAVFRGVTQRSLHVTFQKTLTRETTRLSARAKKSQCRTQNIFMSAKLNSIAINVIIIEITGKL